MRDKYKIKNKVCKAAVKKEKRTLLENEILQLEEVFKSNCFHNLFRTIRNLGKKIKEKYMVMKDKDMRKLPKEMGF